MFWRRFLQNGLPGWMWAGAMTVTAIFEEVHDELSPRFVAFASIAFTAWLSYRWLTGGSKPVEKPEP